MKDCFHNINFSSSYRNILPAENVGLLEKNVLNVKVLTYDLISLVRELV